MIFDITEYKNYHKVSWDKYVTGMPILANNLPKFVTLVSKHLRGNTAVFGGKNCSLHITTTMFCNTPNEQIAEYVRTRFLRLHEGEIVSVYYETRKEAEAFADELEKRYIIDILKR